MCGIVGIVHRDPSFNDVASHLSWALVELQHRGKEASGIVTDRALLKDRGTAEQVFTESNLGRLGGSIGIGHALYTTSGKVTEVAGRAVLARRAQPCVCRFGGNGQRLVYFSFNGNLADWQRLADECRREGYTRPIINDTGVIAALLELSASSSLEKALEYEVLPRLGCSFSIIFYDVAERRLIAARDPLGFMPLFVGVRKGEFLIAASEDCVFAEGGLGCVALGEAPPGSMVILDPGTEPAARWSRWFRGQPAPRYCLFHWIYFSRPDGTFAGRNIKLAQKNAGRRLAHLHPPPADADFVAPVRDSGSAAAGGYAEASGLAVEHDALFRPHTVGRTFMEPHQHLREAGVGKKHRVIPEVVRGKSIVLVDDSVVRATTLKRLAVRLRSAGARAVHVRIASPPVRHPCVYGIDTPTPDELAWNFCGGDVEEIRAYIGADSLKYLDSTDDVVQSILDVPPRHVIPLDSRSFCTQCFTGERATAELEALVAEAVPSPA